MLADVQYAFRILRKTPGFTAVILLTLALSIGANSAIFSVIDGVLLRPLPYPEAGRMTRIFFHSSSYPKFPLNPFDFRDFRRLLRSFDSLAGYTHADLQLSGTGQPERFTAFATVCRESINPDLDDDAVEKMLVQHLLTECERSLVDTDSRMAAG